MSCHIHELKERAGLIWNLYDVRSLLGWDQQTKMPRNGAAGRSQQLASVEQVAHEMLTAPSFVELLRRAEEASAPLGKDDEDRAYVRQVRRRYDLAARVPAPLVAEFSRATSSAVEVWVEARKNNDYKSFAPHLRKVFGLCKQIADHRGYQEHPYDALMDEYEPGISTAEVGAVFAELRPFLSDLLERVGEPSPSSNLLRQPYPEAAQREFSHFLLQQIGFDFEGGRLDDSAHPFCSSSSHGDVRLTDHFQENFLSPGIFGALHEGGHGLYEQNSPARFDGGPLRGGCSLGVHESQSRLWENFVGRSLPFWKFHYPILQGHFPRQLSGYCVEDFYRSINQVGRSFIRIEADEVTYNLHIILRFEIEKDLLTGALDPDDLPEAWNARMREYLGVAPPNDSEGCLQDIHWAFGLVGYFPTYTLGNLVAAQLWRKIRRDIADVDQHLLSGNCRPVLSWLKKNVHDLASCYLPSEVVVRSTDGPIGTAAFMDYVNEKFGALYGVGTR
jgi:carboxypeptidase Taq